MDTNFHKIMGTVGGVIYFLGFLPYIIQVVRKETKPNRTSWLIWSVMGVLILATYYATDARNNLPATVVVAIGPIVTLLLSIKYGEGGLNTLDKGCLFGAGVSLLLWKGLNAPALGLLGALITDGMGMIPTWKDLYKDPTKEKPHAWIIWSVANVCNMFTIERLTIQDALYPTYYLVGTGVSTFLVLRGRKHPKDTVIEVTTSRTEVVTSTVGNDPYRAAMVQETRPAKSRRVVLVIIGISATATAVGLAWRLLQ